MNRHFPSMSYPIERGPERYAQLLKLFAVAKRMTTFGMRVDQRRAQWHLQEAGRRATEFTNLFTELTSLPLSALGDSGSGTTKSIRDYFWQTLGLPPVIFHKKTKKPQFNTASLIIYANDMKIPAAAALYGIRKARTAERFARAYCEVSAHEGGRIHFGFNPLGTKGERWSSAAKFWWREDSGEVKEFSLNVQNIPSKESEYEFEKGTKTKLSLSMRDCFIPDKGCVLLKADYDQLELRLIAYTAGATKLIEWIAAGYDVHMENARKMFLEGKIGPHEHKVKRARSQREADVNKWREAAKPCAYAISYQAPSGRGNDKYPDLFKQLKAIFPDLSEAYVTILVKRFFDLHPEILQWQRDTAQSLSSLGRVVLPATGAFLYLPDSPRGRNQALNFQQQSGGAVLINKATINIDKGCTWAMGESAILAQVHDELLVQSPIHDINRLKDLIEREMGAPAQIGETFAGIPAEADPGLNWKACDKIETFWPNTFGSPED